MKSFRPPLNKGISIEDFEKFYWLKSELQDFCRLHGILVSGSKMEISHRIGCFLRTGQVESTPVKKVEETGKRGHAPGSSCSFDDTALTLNTIITQDFRCSQKLREFMKLQAGQRFHFSIRFQNFCKNNPGKTLKDALDEWQNEQEEKKSGKRTKIAPQFEYNTYIRAFFDDEMNKGRSISEAIQCWKYKRTLPGHNRYERGDVARLDRVGKD